MIQSANSVLNQTTWNIYYPHAQRLWNLGDRDRELALLAKTLERNTKKPRKKGEYLKFVNHVKEDEKGQKASVEGRGLFVTSTFSRRE